MSFDIVEPTNNEIIGSNADVNVKFDLKPSFDPVKEHSIWVIVDGKVIIENSLELEIDIGQLTRGKHILQGQIRDEEGEIVARTRTTSVLIRPDGKNENK